MKKKDLIKELRDKKKKQNVLISERIKFVKKQFDQILERNLSIPIFEVRL